MTARTLRSIHVDTPDTPTTPPVDDVTTVMPQLSRREQRQIMKGKAPGPRDWSPPVSTHPDSGMPVVRPYSNADQYGGAILPPTTSYRATAAQQQVSGAESARSFEQQILAVDERPPLASLDARNISAWFGDHQVLDRVSLTMPAGVITSLIGPSGCGKSTFLRILNRMHELVPSASLAGEVLIDGEDIYDPSRKLVDARKNIGMVFQKPNPFPAMSIYDNVLAGLKLTGTRADRDRRDYLVETCLTKAGLWKEVRDRLRAPGGDSRAASSSASASPGRSRSPRRCC